MYLCTHVLWDMCPSSTHRWVCTYIVCYGMVISICYMHVFILIIKLRAKDFYAYLSSFPDQCQYINFILSIIQVVFLKTSTPPQFVLISTTMFEHFSVNIQNIYKWKTNTLKQNILTECRLKLNLFVTIAFSKFQLAIYRHSLVTQM